MDAIQDVNPNSSNEAKFALAALLGSTMAQLKEIDKSIVGGSSNISSKLDVQRVLQSIQPVQQPQPPILQQHQPAVQQPALSFAPQATVVNAGMNIAVPVTSQATAEEDPNQLVFDFTKKITPDTVNDKLDIIINKLNKIIEFVEAS
jgi:hypothetical protein